MPISHYQAFAVTVFWTLGLLLLGSVVHATDSSLACPDWPTCFGSMTPEMVGGVFWEHLHRLVAGALIVIFALATWITWRREDRKWIVNACWIGLVLLAIQSVFGGLTVLYQLPDAVSTTHLGLAFLFLILAVVLATATSPRRLSRSSLPPTVASYLRTGGVLATGVVFAQSLLGAGVRHMDAGMACGPGLLCNGGVLPPGWNTLIAVQWTHRLLAFVTAAVVIAFALRVLRIGAPAWARIIARLAILLVALQVVLGFVSTSSILAVVPVSLHTLIAASLLAVCALMSSWGYLMAGDRGGVAESAPAAPSSAPLA